MSRLLLLAAALGLLGACAHGGKSEASRPTRAGVLGHYYADGEGLTVVTTGAVVEQPLAGGLSVEVKGLADHIRVDNEDHVHVDDGNPDTGHVDDGVDVVSGASQVVIGGERPQGTIASVYAYELRTKRWLRLADLPTPRHGLGVVASADRVYAVAGGPQPGLTVSGAVESISP